MTLYIKHRPTDFKDVVGNATAMAMLSSMIEEEKLPNVIMLIGPSGTGKTTTARIMADLLGCRFPNLSEVNCADVRGIDSVREIRESMGTLAMGGGVKVWILDEVVQLPKATQQAFLKVLEDQPKHVYFFLCTTDTTGLLPTFTGRCLCVNLYSLAPTGIGLVLNRVLDEEGRSLDAKVFSAICNSCQGSAREALMMLEGALAHDNVPDQMEAIGIVSVKEEEKAGFLARLILSGNKWNLITKAIAGVEEKEIEGLRRQVLSYCAKVLMNKPDQRAYYTIRCFEASFQFSGKAGLVAACYDAAYAKTE